MTTTIIYINAICDRQTKQGAYQAEICHGDKSRYVRGIVHRTTNHRLELTAIIEALSSIEYVGKVRVITSDAYITSALGDKARLDRWRRNNYEMKHKDTGEIVTRPHKDLWEVLYSLASDKDMLNKKTRGKIWQHEERLSATMWMGKQELEKFEKKQLEIDLMRSADRARISRGQQPYHKHLWQTDEEKALEGHPDRIEITMPTLKPMDLSKIDLTGKTKKGRTMDDFRREAHAIRNG